MPNFGFFLAIIILSLGLALAGTVARILWLFCQGASAIERKPWEE